MKKLELIKLNFRNTSKIELQNYRRMYTRSECFHESGLFSQGRFGQVFLHSGWLVAEQLKVCDFFFWKMLTRPPQQAIKG